MDQLTMGFWIQLFIYGISFGVFGGSVMIRLAHLEKKMDKHNHLVERITVCERDLLNTISDVKEIKSAKKIK